MKNGDYDLFGLKYFLLISMVVNPASAFTFQCPSPFQWNLRAKSQCSIIDGYICLFDENKNSYTEICRTRTYFDPAGYKFVIAGNPDRRKCESTRYQPFKFSTNGRTVCIFEKTYCSEEGQIIFNNGSTESNRQCRCDYTREYDFITKPKHGCYCVPSTEDCSCYQKSCPQGFILSPDYQCINLTSWSSQFTCDLILPSKPKDTNHPSNDNNLDGGKAAPERIVRIVLGIVIVVTLIVTLIMVQTTWFCLPKIESFKVKKNVLRENIELRSILAGKVIPQNIKDLQQHAKKQWRERFCHFVETRAALALLERIKEEQCFIISGPFGCGKTSLAFHIARKLEDALGFDFMIISNPEDILRYASEDKKQIFLIDDAFGKFSVSKDDTFWWKRQGVSIQHLVTRNKNLRLLMTSRLHIYNSVNNELKVKCCPFNLISKDLALTVEERKGIGRCYLPGDIIDINLSKEVIVLYSFFPTLCANFYDGKNEKSIHYFNCPVEYIKTDIENISKPPDLSYLTLAVLIICGNNVKKDMFNKDNHKFDEMLKFVSNELGYGKKPSKQVLSQRFVDLTDSYISNKESSFECLHADFFGVLAFCIGPCIMKSILQYGKTSFIIERMQSETSSGNYPNLTIAIPKSLQDTYFERMLLDMNAGLNNIFVGNQHDIDENRISYIAYMKKHLKKGDMSKGKDGSTVLHLVSAEGYEDYVNFFVKLDKKLVNESDTDGQTALHKACMKGYINVAKLLLNNSANIEKNDKTNKTAFDIAFDSDINEMVELLLSRKASIRQNKTDFRTALHDACDNNNYKMAEILLKYKANVNQQDSRGYTPILLACKKGHVGIIELLIKEKPKVNDYDYKKGRTALYFAVNKNYINVVEGLLNLNANTNIASTEGKAPLFCACEQGYFEIARMLITHDAFVDSDDKQMCTPLYVACKNGHFRVAELLLNNKANVNKRNKNRNTTMLIACETNHIEIVKLLLKNKADVNCKNKALQTPLLVACKNNHKDIVSLLIKHGALVDEPDASSQTPLFLACLKGHFSVAVALLRYGASMSKSNPNGQTPLHIACKEVHEDTVKILLNAGANVNESDKDGMTPLHVACIGGREEIVKVLINAGADVGRDYKDGNATPDIIRKVGRKAIVSKANVDVNTGEDEQMPPLYNACKEGNEAMVKELLDSVACVNEGDKDGMTPLHMACKGGRELIVTMLINAGVNVNKSDKNGITPLQMACIEENEGIVKVLLNSVANVNEGDKDGSTPLHVVCKSANKDIVTLLLNAGANVNKRDKNGIKPLQIAYKAGSEDTLNEVSNLSAKSAASEFVIVDSAREGGKEEIVRLLLGAGAAVNQENQEEKKSILDYFFHKL